MNDYFKPVTSLKERELINKYSSINKPEDEDLLSDNESFIG